MLAFRQYYSSSRQMVMGNKRKNVADPEERGREKKAKKGKAVMDRKREGTSRTPAEAPSHQPGPSSQKANMPQSKPKNRPRIRKLAPPRPFPTVALASSATGPRSAHREGKNCICITRKTKLAAYLRRCKALLVDDGFKELRLSAMGAAIPHLALLAVSLPQMLPWAENEVLVDVFTGSQEVHDERLSDSGEEGSQEEFRTRMKSTMNVIIRIGLGESPDKPVCPPGNEVNRQADGRGEEGGVPEEIVLEEPEQDGVEA